MQSSKSSTSFGMNRTGIAMSPIDTSKMLKPTSAPTPPPGNSKSLFRVRENYLRDTDPLGTVPLPGTLKGVAKSVVQKLKGEKPEIFLDKLGERLAFERSGVRLYELLINKCEARPDEITGSTITKLNEICEEEKKHFELLGRVIQDLGGDATVMTPSADVVGVIGHGLIQVLSDPRTSLEQSLQAILVAELADGNSWRMLIRLSEQQGLSSVANDFRSAETNERRHLEQIYEFIEKLIFDNKK